MPLPSSHVVEVMARMRSTVSADLAGPVPDLRVEIASPAQVGNVTQPTVTLFLYNLERSGTALAPASGLPTALILYVLVTAYAPAVPGGDAEPVGLRELKLLALVGRVFGAERNLGTVPIEDTAPVGLVARIEPQSLAVRVYLDALDNEDINHIWTTQTQTAYRTSLSYRIEFGLLTPFAPILEGPPVLSVREEVEDASVPLPDLGGAGRAIEARRATTAQGALVAIDPDGGIASELTLEPPQPGPGLDVPLLAASAETITVDLSLSVLRSGETTWAPAAPGRLAPVTLDTVAVTVLQSPPSLDATAATITIEDGDAAYRITASSQGQALPVFAPVIVLLEGVPLGPEDGG